MMEMRSPKINMENESKNYCKFVVVPLERGCGTGKRGEKNTTQAVAYRGAKTAFKRLDDELGIISALVLGVSDVGTFDFHHNCILQSDYFEYNSTIRCS